MSAGAVAVADWGTTRLRLWLLDEAGGVLAERRSDEGLLAAQPDRFSAILERHLSDMGAGADLPVVICGMAGSRQGWLEAPYVTVPASLGEIFGGAVRIPGQNRDIRIVPGLAQRATEAPDVMRGEETQLAGASAALSSGRRIVCMPGTHSKWVELADGVVTGFQTFMTGELFALLSEASVLRHGMQGATGRDDAAFDTGVSDALSRPERLGARLFSLRAEGLIAGLSPDAARARLSGLLIGTELAGAKPYWLGQRVTLVGAEKLSAAYARALAAQGIAAERMNATDCTLAGLAALAPEREAAR